MSHQKTDFSLLYSKLRVAAGFGQFGSNFSSDYTAKLGYIGSQRTVKIIRYMLGNFTMGTENFTRYIRIGYIRVLLYKLLYTVELILSAKVCIHQACSII